MSLRRATIANVNRLLVVVRDITERKQSEESARLGERRFTKMFEEAPIGIVLLDPERNVFASNRMFREFVGYSEEEIVAGGLKLFTYPEDRQAAIKLSDSLRAGEMPYFIMEHRYVRKDSKVVWAELSVVAIRDESGKLLHTIAWVKDIDERKRAEEELREAETKFRAMFEGSRDAINVSIKGVQVFANSAFLKLYGYDSIEEIVGTSITDHIAPDHRRQIFQNLERRAAGEDVPSFYETRARKKDGTEFDEEVNVSTYELKGEVYSLAIIRDVTERKRAERMLRENENRMRTIVEGTPYLFFYTQDTQGRITYVSPSVEAITGRSAEEWRSQSHWFTTKEQMNDHARKSTQAHLRGEFTKGPILVEVEHADSRPILLEVYENPMIADGKVVGLQGVAHDITERKRAEEKIKEQLSFEEFLYELSKEFASTSGDECDSLINSAMERICPHFGAEAAYIQLVSENGNSYSVKYEWHGEGYPGMGDSQNTRGTLPWSERVVFGGDTLKINTPDDIPREFPTEVSIRRKAGVKSVLIVPLHGRKNSINGAVGMRTFSKARHWLPEDEQRLRLISDIIGNVLERKRAEESLQASLDQLHKLNARLETVAEEERKSISHEVHDELGQILTAIRLDLATLNETGARDEGVFGLSSSRRLIWRIRRSMRSRKSPRDCGPRFSTTSALFLPWNGRSMSFRSIAILPACCTYRRLSRRWTANARPYYSG